MTGRTGTALSALFVVLLLGGVAALVWPAGPRVTGGVVAVVAAGLVARVLWVQS